MRENEICAERLRALLEDCSHGPLHVLDCTDSTNRFADTLARQGAPEGTAVLADCQTAGRGRRGRSFFSPAGTGLYLSVVLRPQAKPEQLLHLTPLAALAVCDAVDSVCGFRPQIKWINDLIHDGRKLGGILTELKLDAERNTQYVILGVGLNCAPASFPTELRSVAGCLSDAAGAEIDRTALAAAVIRSVLHMNAGLFTDLSKKMRQYAQNCVTIGKEVRVLRGENVREAFAEGISPDGGLLVRYPDGSRETVSSGEVSVRGMYGYAE